MWPLKDGVTRFFLALEDELNLMAHEFAFSFVDKNAYKSLQKYPDEKCHLNLILLSRPNFFGLEHFTFKHT